MSIELKVPEIGESITEVIIGEWLKHEGEYVQRDEDVVLVESDKATVEIPAPDSGKLVSIIKQSGEHASVGEVIARLEAGSRDTSPSQEERSNREKAKGLRIAGSDEDKKNAREEATDRKAAKPADQRGQTKKTEPDLAQGIAPEREEKTDRARAGSEDGGRVTEDGEVNAEIEQTGTEEENKIGIEATGEEQRDLRRPAVTPMKTFDDAGVEKQRRRAEKKPVVERGARGAREEKAVPMTPIRMRIAERLVHAQQTTAFLTTFNEIDMSAVQKLRHEFQQDFQNRFDVKLGYMSFFVKASIEALKLVPQVNAELRGKEIIYRHYYDIGVAVGGGKGLVVPVLRNAENMTFAEIEQAIDDYARRAEQNRLKPGDLEGGTFTITNGGIYGSLLSTPVINPPQSGILGMHAIQERPVVRDGGIVIRSMMYVALTYDHRIVDGREAVTFLKRIKQCIEAPSRILLEI